MRTSRVLAEALHLVLLVGFEVAFEPVPLRGILVRAFPGEDVSGDPVEEPTVVRHDHGAAGELEKGVLQGSQGLDVEVVRRLIEQEQVAALLEREREIEAVALTAGEHAGLLLLVRSLESERRDIGARGHLHRAHLDEVETVGDDLPQALVRADAAAGLLRVGDLDRVSDLERTAGAPVGASAASVLSSAAASSWGRTMVLSSVHWPPPLGPMAPTLPVRGREKLSPSMSCRPSKPFPSESASVPTSPRRGQAGIWISSKSSL